MIQLDIYIDSDYVAWFKLKKEDYEDLVKKDMVYAYLEYHLISDFGLVYRFTYTVKEVTD